jgi:4'-phosphopantetheinyl transferase EntD
VRLKEIVVPELAVAFASAAEADEVIGTSSKHADFVAGRLAATRALTALAGSGQHSIERSVDGRPIGLVDGRRIELSISHIDGLAASVATSSSCPVGIDLVRANTVRPTELRFFLTERERARTAAYDPTVLWALKEAAWKAVGGSRAMPFKSVELELDAEGRVAGVGYRAGTRAAESLILTPWPGFRAAVVWLLEAA